MATDCPQPDDDPLEGLEASRDREEVRDLLARHWSGFDTRRDDAGFLRSVFAEQATVEFPSGERSGLDDIGEAVRELHALWKTTLHAVSSEVITLCEDSAHVAAALHATHLHRDDDPGAPLHLGARLGAEAVRTGDGWRLRRLAIGVVWTTGDPPGTPP